MEFSDYQDLCDAGRVQTPAYIFNVDVLRDRIRYVKSRLPDMGICYAMKANPFLIAAACGTADSFEICSPGEERICEKAGVPVGQMVLSGVNKEAADFERIFEYAKAHCTEGSPICTVESLQQINMLEDTAAKVYGDGHVTDVLLRVTTGTQFGMDDTDVIGIIRERASYPHLHIRGIQVFSGTQKKMRNILKEIKEADALIARIESEYAFKIEMFEFGPGLPVSYFKTDKPVDDDAWLKELYDALVNMEWKGEISLEMGRFLAASCGTYITRIMDIKRNRNVNYLICDGGIHQVNYFGQMLAMKLPYMLAGGHEVPLPEGDEDVYTVCGSLCTVNDLIVKGVPLQHPKVGDILVFMNVGAYSVTEGISLFLSRDLPRVYSMEGIELTEIRGKIKTEEFNYG